MHQGKEICLNSNEDTVTLVDVTNKNNPVQLSSTPYSGSAYTHQGWSTEDQAYFLVDDELDEQNFGHNTRTRVFDVSDLDAPSLIGSYDSDNAAIDHNQYVKGDYSYQANHLSGLRILDISGVATANVAEVAYFDIYPADDAAQFNGAWSNYPYFDSGIVDVSGIEQGVFVLRPNLGPTDSPPTVNVTDPAEAATVSGTSVPVAASASDDDGGVTQVEFFVDGISIGVDTTSPYGSPGTRRPCPTARRSSDSATATDTIGQTTSDANNVTVDNVTVDNVPDPTVHVGGLDATVVSGRGGKWDATVTITVHDEGDGAVSGATVSGAWSSGATGSGPCVTEGADECVIVRSNIKRSSPSVTFDVTNVVAADLACAPGDNHDPDGDSDGTTIVVPAP